MERSGRSGVNNSAPFVGLYALFLAATGPAQWEIKYPIRSSLQFLFHSLSLFTPVHSILSTDRIRNSSVRESGRREETFFDQRASFGNTDIIDGVVRIIRQVSRIGEI